MLNPHSAEFHRLHQQGLLILPNAWDAGSARVVQSAGALAVATSSAAVAWSHGYADGNALPGPLLLQSVRAIFGAINVPLSVDIESGGSDDPVAVAEFVYALMDAGAVGINLEDGDAAPELLCAKIQNIRKRCGDAVYINARTDVYIRNPVPPAQRVAEVLRRAALYRDAGASGLFAIRIVAADEIAAVVAGTALPLNVMACPGLPAATELQALGVRRVSAGSGMAEVLHGAFAAMATEFLHSARIPALPLGELNYGQLNQIMAR